MLKGFFDSLPQELYEAATIDGASEIRIFFQITMSLSKPILAVVALGAFNSAYGTFLYALIVAPDPNMWVLNVWLYQWQQNASTAAIFASVLVASIPTLLVSSSPKNHHARHCRPNREVSLVPSFLKSEVFSAIRCGKVRAGSRIWI